MISTDKAVTLDPKIKTTSLSLSFKLLSKYSTASSSVVKVLLSTKAFAKTTFWKAKFVSESNELYIALGSFLTIFILNLSVLIVLETVLIK